MHKILLPLSSGSNNPYLDSEHQHLYIHGRPMSGKTYLVDSLIKSLCKSYSSNDIVVYWARADTKLDVRKYPQIVATYSVHTASKLIYDIVLNGNNKVLHKTTIIVFEDIDKEHIQLLQEILSESINKHVHFMLCTREEPCYELVQFFKVRIALRCSKSASNILLATSDAAKISDRFGKCYSRMDVDVPLYWNLLQKGD